MPDNPVTHRSMEPLPTVFGGEKETPHAVFERGRRDNEGSGTVTARANDAAMECPRCRAEGQENIRLWVKDKVGYYCMAQQHVWKDLDSLMNANPRKMAFKGTATKQSGFKKITFEVPGSVEEQLIAKFGDRLGATFTALADVVSSPKFLLIGEYDLKRLSDKLGQDVTSSALLVGKLFEFQEAKTESDETIKKLRSNIARMASTRPGMAVQTDSTVVVDMGDDLSARLAARAEKNGMPVEEYIRQVTAMAIDGEWL